MQKKGIFRITKSPNDPHSLPDEGSLVEFQGSMCIYSRENEQYVPWSESYIIKLTVVTNDPIHKGEWYLPTNTFNSEITKYLHPKQAEYDYAPSIHGFKAIVLPEQFSKRTIESIIKGELKDGDEVFVSYISDDEMFLDSFEEAFITKSSFSTDTTYVSGHLYTEEEVKGLVWGFHELSQKMHFDTEELFKGYWEENRKK